MPLSLLSLLRNSCSVFCVCDCTAELGTAAVICTELSGLGGSAGLTISGLAGSGLGASAGLGDGARTMVLRGLCLGFCASGSGVGGGVGIAAAGPGRGSGMVCGESSIDGTSTGGVLFLTTFFSQPAAASARLSAAAESTRAERNREEITLDMMGSMNFISMNATFFMNALV